ncbi:hypothetical protein [Dipodfec virus UOA04_Rod_663]|nr:hypothetical protein [Dipodfec virus UOA04_Rod_663]
MKEIVTILLEISWSGIKSKPVKWSVVIALVASIAALLMSCGSVYKSTQSCVRGQDTIVMTHTIEGRINKQK